MHHWNKCSYKLQRRINNMLDDNTSRLYDVIHDFIEQNGFSPSIREICKLMKNNSISTILNCLESLEEGGYIKRKAKTSRSITLTHKIPDKKND
jgi:repressor LexA